MSPSFFAQHRIAGLIGLLALLQGFSARAWPPTYGSEYNFSNQRMVNARLERKRNAKNLGNNWQKPREVEQDAATDFAKRVEKRCGQECTVTAHPGKFGSTEYRVTFQDGYSFNISVDPACVEVQTSPETLEELKKNEPRAQRFIFSIAQDLGLTGERETAHFNVGLLSAFDGDPKGFLKFLVNFHNYEELASGALGSDFANAPPISHLKAGQKAALAKIVDQVNRGKIRTPQEVAVRIMKQVYTSTPVFDAGYHYQGVSVKYVRADMGSGSDQPFEIRSPRQPRSAQERTLLAELFQKRMEFEKGNPDPIVFLDIPDGKARIFSKRALANRFRLYLLEMGADWEYFKRLLPKELQRLPSDAFLSNQISWASSGDIDLLKTYLQYVPSSSWVRERMLLILRTPEAARSGKLPEVLAAAKAVLGSNASAEGRRVLNEFLTTVDPDYIPEKRSIWSCLVNALKVSR